nr:DUF3967 domain-containing protein [Bacillus sp. V5-8f]
MESIRETQETKKLLLCSKGR